MSRSFSLFRSSVYWLFLGAIFSFLFGLGMATSAVPHEARDTLFIALLYGLLSFFLTTAAVSLTARDWRLGLGWAAVQGLLLGWHFREQAGLPEGTPAFLALCALLAGVSFAAAAAVRRSVAATPPLRWSMAGALVFCAVFAASYHASETLRWHLLQRHRLLGTPAYYLMSPSVTSQRAELWSRPAAGGAAAPAEVPSPAAAKPGPHIIFVLLDTWRRDSLAVFGGDPGLMPKLNRRAAESVVFEDVLSNSSWTRPSVASFWTGLLPEEHGAIDRGFALAESQVTLAETLGQLGYFTAAFVSNYGALGREFGFDQGFDLYHELRKPAARRADAPYRRAEHVNRAVRGWMEQRGRAAASAGRPMFLYLHYLDPHTPYFSGGRASLRPTVSRKAYDAELTYLDGELDAMIEFLLAELDGPTVLMIASDHGEEFGEHDGQGHGYSLYSELVSVPVIVATGSPAGGQQPVEAKLESRDFFDLLVQMALDPDLDIHGWARKRSRRERYSSVYLTTGMALHRPYLGKVCIRAYEAGGHIFISSAYGPTRELYASVTDPGQRHNLARSRPDLAAALETEMDSHVTAWTTLSPAGATEDTVRQLRALGYLQ